MKRNFFVRKGECWQCNENLHLLIITKYNGLLCKKCYQEKHEEMKELFLASFEVEYDTNYEEETKKLCDIIDMIHGNYEECCYNLEDEEPKEKYRKVVNRARELYLEVKEFDTTSMEGVKIENKQKARRLR